MKTNKKIALDIDDVLACFYQDFCKYLNRKEDRINIWDGEKDAKWIKDNFKLVENNKVFWTQLNTLSNPESIDFDVECYITASPASMIKYRKLWLEINGFPKRPVYHSSNKLEIMNRLNIDILIDDKPDTINNINKNGKGKLGIQFKPGYMSKDSNDRSKIITHLSEVKKFL